MDDDYSSWAPGAVAIADGRTPVPATGAWRPGDHPGRRQFLDIEALPLEADPLGSIDVTLAYETWGELNSAGDNAVYVAHAFTGDSHVTGEAGEGHITGGWWNGLVGAGKPIDPARHFIVSANVVGGCQGSTGPAHPHPTDGRPWGSRFPWLTLRDMVAAEVRLTEALGVDAWKLIVGPSMGGMRAIEWAASYPHRVRGIGSVGATAATTADQLAWTHAQTAAIALDPAFRGGDYYDADAGEGPHRGLSVARAIAHTTYRAEAELNQRFGRRVQEGSGLRPHGLYAVQSYLEHHGDKLARRFDANSYLRMAHAVATHDVGRDRGGVNKALTAYSGGALIVAVDSDRLYPQSNSDALLEALPQAGEVSMLHSEIGHDSFLVDSPELSGFVADFEASL